MKRFNMALVASLFALALVTGCSRSPQRAFLGVFGLPQTPVMPPPGFLFQEIQAPLTVHNPLSGYDQTQATPGKTGTATSRFIGLPFYAFLSIGMDDCSIEAAARNGGLSSIEYADYRSFNVLGVYREFTVKAYGK